jgi:DNA-binding NarL/FixJ family response regulator
MTRVAIVDDHGLFRAGVRAELEGHVELVARPRASRRPSRWSPRSAPTSSCSTSTCPTAAAWRSSAARPTRRPTPSSSRSQASDAAEDVIATIRAGARGYVTKNIATDELLDAIARVQAGDAVFSPRLAGFVLDAFAGPRAVGRDADAELDQLTAREREVLRHIARGYMYKEVALRSGISAKTVEAHVSAVLRKLQLSNRHELSRWAAERRWTRWSR